MIAAVRKGLVHGIILGLYAVLGYLIAFIVMGGKV